MSPVGGKETPVLEQERSSWVLWARCSLEVLQGSFLQYTTAHVVPMTRRWVGDRTPLLNVSRVSFSTSLRMFPLCNKLASQPEMIPPRCTIEVDALYSRLYWKLSTVWEKIEFTVGDVLKYYRQALDVKPPSEWPLELSGALLYTGCSITS